MSTTRFRNLTSRKVIDLAALLAHRNAARASGKTVVHCHGCFDIVHPGHIRYFQFARQQGDVLVVSLTGDPHVNKGEGRPYVPQELRAEQLAALEFIDYVYINPTGTAAELLSAFKPDIYIKGREYEHNSHPGFLKEKATVESYGGRVIFSSGDVVYSSSQIIDNFGGGGRLDLEQEKLALFARRYNVRKHVLLDIMDTIVDQPFVVLGDMILDRYQFCDATDLAGDGPMMSLAPLEKRDYLGGAAMIARHLAGLGAEPTLITSLGTDDASDAAIDDLEAGGVHVLAIRNRRKIAAETLFVVDAQKLFTLDECPDTPTDSTNERYAIEQVRKLAAVADGAGGAEAARPSLILYDAGLGMLTDSIAHTVLSSARPADGDAAAPGYGMICGGTAGARGRLGRLQDVDLLVATERAIRTAMRDHEKGLSALAYQVLNDFRGRALLTPLGKKGLLAFDAREPVGANEAWEGKLRCEYLASPLNGGAGFDRLGAEEAMLAIAGGMLAGGANVQQAAYVALTAAVLESRQLGHVPIGGHELRELLDNRPELAD